MAESEPRTIEFQHQSPGWGAEGVEPSPEYKQSGYVAGYKPPAGFFNWFWKRVSDNVSELQDVATGYVAENEDDKKAIRHRISIGNKVYDETTQRTGAERFGVQKHPQFHCKAYQRNAV